MTTKTCSRCRVPKELDAFFRGRASHGRNAYCKDCHNEYRRQRKGAGETYEPLVDRECSKCGMTKPADQFHKSTNLGARGRAYHCKACHTEYYRERKRRDPDYFNKFLRKNRAKRREWVTHYKASHGCADCGEKHPACLDLHHRDPSVKEKEVCKLVDAAREMTVIQAEVAKCTVLCSNCHRKRHYNDRQAAAQSVA